MYNVVIRRARRGTKKADDSHLKTFNFRRSYNARVIEVGSGKFPNLDEATEAAKNAHMADFQDYVGNPVDMQELDFVEETAFPDVMWGIAEEGQAFDKDIPLKPGYVTSDDIQEIVTQFGTLDFDWPSDRRLIRGLMDRCRRIIIMQETHNKFE